MATFPIRTVRLASALVGPLHRPLAAAAAGDPPRHQVGWR